MSSSVSILVRDAVFNDLQSAKNAGSFITSNFDLCKTHLPEYILSEAVRPQVSVVAQPHSQQVLTRARSKSAEIPVTVGLQSKVDINNFAQIDDLVVLVEQLMDIVTEVRIRGMIWSRTEPIRDDANFPANFVVVKDAHVFQGIFYSYFSAAIE